MAEENQTGFKVTDRRLFNADGSVREDALIIEEEAAPQPAPAAPMPAPAPPAFTAADITGAKQFAPPPPPTPPPLSSPAPAPPAFEPPAFGEEPELGGMPEQT